MGLPTLPPAGSGAGGTPPPGPLRDTGADLWRGAGEEAVFAPARKTLAWIKGLAAKVGCPVEEEALPAGEWERTPPLRHLEQALFAHPMPPIPAPGTVV
ncbi:MAG: hypothetical protein ACLR1T_03665 [Evtepia gabavorous]